MLLKNAAWLLPMALTGYSAGACADGAAWEWIERMNNAVRMQTYTGTAVLRSGKHMDTLQVVHVYRDGVEQERVLSLSGEPREVLRDQGEVRVALPEQGIQIIEEDQGRGLLPTLGESARHHLSQHYRINLSATPGRIAGRRTHVVTIEPRDEWRWGYKIELDAETAMPLQLEVRNGKQAVLEQIQFVTVEYPDMLGDEMLQPSMDISHLEVVRARRPQPSPADQELLNGWEVAEPPPGFRLSNRSWARLPGVAESVAHWVYSDGLASISIYANAVGAAASVPEARVSSGAVSTFRKMVNGVTVTAMGEVPLQTARWFSLGLRPAEAQP